MRTKLIKLLQNDLRFLRHIIPKKIRTGLKVFLNEHLVPNPMVFQGIKLWRHPIKADSNRVEMIFGNYENDTTKLLLSILQPGMHFVDVGAHIGYFTIQAAKAVGTDGKVWAFEPMPSTYILLKRNINENNVSYIVEAVPQAVTDKISSVLLFPHLLIGRSSIFERKGMIIKDANRVGSISLDSFFEKRGWPLIDLIKIDIEGAETTAIRGMFELSQRNPKIKLFVEFNLVTMEAARCRPKEFFSVLQKVGFNTFYIIGYPKTLSIPDDIPWLINYTLNMKNSINLFCEKL